MFIGVIFNPHARKNQAAPGRSAELRKILGQWGEVHETHSVGDLREVLGELCPRVTHLVSDGGDGSLNWLINEVEHCVSDPEQWPTFVASNGGSVNAVARKAGVQGRPKEILRELTHAAKTKRPPPEIHLDTLSLDGETEEGEKFHRLCFGLAAGGVGNRFYDRYYDNHTHGRADVLKVMVRSLRDYVSNKVSPGKVREARPNYASRLFLPTHARVVIDGDEVPTRQHRLLHAGAIDLHIAGPFRLFPKAAQPGALHFQAGDLRPSGIIAQAPRAFSSGKIRGKSLRDVIGYEMVIEAEDEPLSPIIDGERFLGITRLVASAGPLIRLAQIESSGPVWGPE
jgi:Diacylglycerol kinase catalytic domain